VNIKRKLRTTASEVFLLYEENQNIGEVHLHYSTRNYATIILNQLVNKATVERIVNEIKDSLLSSEPELQPYEISIFNAPTTLPPKSVNENPSATDEIFTSIDEETLAFDGEEI
jgi:hypothetical protein